MRRIHRLLVLVFPLALAAGCASTGGSTAPARAAGGKTAEAPPQPAPPSLPALSTEAVAKVQADLVWIRPGSLPAGFRTPKSFATAKKDPAVKINGFWMGKHEVTQAEWTAVMGESPGETAGDGELPVANVSWPDANRFLDRLNHAKGDTAFRLPSAEEWEYACRAGVPGHVPAQATDAILSQFAWWAKNSGERAHPVARLKPNAWGLFDMLGNVAEWCETASDDARGDTPLRITAGASFADANLVGQDCRPGGAMGENGKDAYTGFRLAMAGPAPSPGKRPKK